ncbi:MAG: DUF998 domain-containing protein [Methanomassiliicoccaceae archaeon]|nr:DUF998 domain-containing protein [Methanomassiliicoccaceae archaeon]
MEPVKERNILIGTLAVIAVIVFAICWFAAAMSDPEWIFGTNYLSDLGVSGYEWAHKYFNGGCLIAGVLFALCGTAIVVSRKRKLDIAAGVFAVLSGICISLIGVVTEDAGDPHYYLALTAFGSGFICLTLISIRDWTDGLRILAPLTPAGMIIIAASAFILLRTAETDAVAPGVETVLVIIMISLFMLQGMKFIYHGASERYRGIADRHKTAFGFTALLGAAAFLLLWLLASVTDGSWTFGSDPAYVLGLSPDDVSNAYFSFACVTGGLLTVIYGIGAGLMHNGALRSVGGSFAVLAGIVLTAIGIMLLLRNDMSACIEQIAVTLGAASLLLVTASDWIRKRMVTASFYLAMIIVCVLSALAAGYDAASAFFVLALFAVLGTEGVRLLISE